MNMRHKLKRQHIRNAQCLQWFRVFSCKLSMSTSSNKLAWSFTTLETYTIIDPRLHSIQ